MSPKSSIISLWLGTALCAATLFGGCAYEEGFKDVDGVERIRLHASLSSDDSLLLNNQSVQTKVRVAGIGKVARGNYYADRGTWWSSRSEKADVCNAYVGRFQNDDYEVDYRNPPEVLWEGGVTKDVNVDSYGRVETTFSLTDGSWTSTELAETCTLKDVQFTGIDNIYFETAVAVSEETCNTFCGVQVNTYCTAGCNGTSYANFYYAWSSTSCYESCRTTETPFCKETCRTKETIVAKGSVYGYEIQLKTDDPQSLPDPSSSLASAVKDGDALDLTVKLKIEPYAPLNR